VPKRLTESRAIFAAMVIAAHAAFLYLLMTFGFSPLRAVVPTVHPIEVSLIRRVKRRILIVSPLEFRPQLAKLQITSSERSPDFRIKVPEELIARPKPTTAMTGSPAPHGAIVAVGGRVALRFTHYVVPTYSARAGQQRSITLALLVAPTGTIEFVKILRSTGSSQLDQAAVTAARQWRFAPFERLPDTEVWSAVRMDFGSPSPLLGVPLDIMPYTAVARQIDSEIEKQQPGHASWTKGVISRLLDKLVAQDRGRRRGADRGSPEDSLEAKLARQGPVRFVRFVGVVPHGMDYASPDSIDPRRRSRFMQARWQVYDVEQQRGFSVWLVKATPLGVIRRIEVAIR
jgi:TonB family protein